MGWFTPIQEANRHRRDLLEAEQERQRRQELIDRVMQNRVDYASLPPVPAVAPGQDQALGYGPSGMPLEGGGYLTEPDAASMKAYTDANAAAYRGGDYQAEWWRPPRVSMENLGKARIERPPTQQEINRGLMAALFREGANPSALAGSTYGTDVDADVKRYVKNMELAQKQDQWTAEGGGPGARPFDVSRLGEQRNKEGTWGARRGKARDEARLTSRQVADEIRARDVFSSVTGQPPELSGFRKDEAKARTGEAEAESAPSYYTNRADAQAASAESMRALAGLRGAKKTTEEEVRPWVVDKAEAGAGNARLTGDMISQRVMNYAAQWDGIQSDNRRKSASADTAEVRRDATREYLPETLAARRDQAQAQARGAGAGADLDEFRLSMAQEFDPRERQQRLDRLRDMAKRAKSDAERAEIQAQLDRENSARERSLKIQTLEKRLERATSDTARANLQAQLDEQYAEDERKSAYDRTAAMAETARARQRTAESGARVAEGTESAKIATAREKQREAAARATFQDLVLEIEQKYGAADRESALNLAATKTELVVARTGLMEAKAETEKFRQGLVTRETEAKVAEGLRRQKAFEEEIKKKAAEARLAEIELEMTQAGVPDAARRAKALADKEVALAEKAGVDVMTAKERFTQEQAETEALNPFLEARNAEAKSKAERAATYALTAKEEQAWKEEMAPVDAAAAQLKADLIAQRIAKEEALTGKAQSQEALAAATTRLREADLQRRQKLLPYEERLTEAKIKKLVQSMQTENPARQEILKQLLRSGYPASGKSGSRGARKQIEQFLETGEFLGTLVGRPQVGTQLTAPDADAAELFYGGR